MRRLSLATLSAGLGLALLTAPLAMAQAYPNHHTNSAPHATASHRMQAPIHRAVSIHNRMSPRMSHAAHVQPREVAVRHHVVLAAHHAAMPPHHGPLHQG